MEKGITISRKDGKVIMEIEDAGQKLTATIPDDIAIRLAAELLHAVFYE